VQGQKTTLRGKSSAEKCHWPMFARREGTGRGIGTSLNSTKKRPGGDRESNKKNERHHWTCLEYATKI